MAIRYVCIKPSGYTLDGAESALYSAEYTSMAGAEAGENGAFSDDLYIDIIHGDGSFNWNGTDDTTAVIWDGWDCTSGAKVIVRTLTVAQSANGVASRPDFSNGTRDLTEYRLYKNNGVSITIDNDAVVDNKLDIEFLGLQIEMHTNTGSNVSVVGGAYHTATTFEKCWFKNSTADWDIVLGDRSGQPVKFTNCVLDGAGSALIGIRILGTGEVSLINTTLFSYGDGVLETSTGTYKLVNNIIADNTDDFDGAFTGTNNASDDQDGPGTDIGPIDGADDWTGELETPWTDLRPLNSGNIYHAGEVQNNDSDIPSDDIAGNPRPTGASAPTIGAFEFVESGGTTQSVSGSLPVMSGAITMKKAYHRSLGGSI